MPVLTPTLLNTERLALRWPEERDRDAIFAIYSDPAVVRYWSNEAWSTLAQADEWIASRRAGNADGSGVCLVVTLAGSGELIGTLSLYHFFEQSRRCDIGYAFGSRHWGKGYAYESLHVLLEYGFRHLDLNRIEADIDPGNAPSGRVLERLGFRKEGYMPERWIVHGETADTVFYGLLKSYWDTKPS
ncbi:GNAT family N-acetyltransferase [Massilia horti]|uniref:N-acetyltransferase n=1 Tax=Massilia horti TaxID=2562153 RepID=A0A4Y9T6Z0_9BURK|nr:GNAT family N-acetyltransferase [Massilia horti]TFW34168.1 N-acetyltransferase [Massilia horti]